MAMRIVINEPKTKKSWQIEKDVPALIGRKLGEKIEGSLIGLGGFVLQITGGSDKEGFPMRAEVDGPGRKRLLLSGPPGFIPRKEGQRKRKNIVGNTISDRTGQINCKVVEGAGDIPTILGIPPKQKAEGTEEKKA